jgi:hypothetical protein
MSNLVVLIFFSHYDLYTSVSTTIHLNDHLAYLNTMLTLDDCTLLPFNWTSILFN